ncbi:4Fe-4S dicluster domain-containing protein [Thermococcus sp.]
MFPAGTIRKIWNKIRYNSGNFLEVFNQNRKPFIKEISLSKRWITMVSLNAKPTIFINPERCIGCRHCEIACAVEHSKSKNLFSAIFEDPRPQPRIHVLPMGAYNVPMNCRHCDGAPCVEVCPTGALYHDEDGAVMIKPDKCIGCKMCAIVCPFGIPEFDYLTGIMFKCDMCPDRRAEGRPPACVEACKTGALQFGTIDEIVNTVRKATAEKIIKLKEGEYEEEYNGWDLFRALNFEIIKINEGGSE